MEKFQATCYCTKLGRNHLMNSWRPEPINIRQDFILAQIIRMDLKNSVTDTTRSAGLTTQGCTAHTYIKRGHQNDWKIHEMQGTLALGQLLQLTTSIHWPCSLLTSWNRIRGEWPSIKQKSSQLWSQHFTSLNPRNMFYSLVWSFIGSALSRELFCPCNPVVTHLKIIAVGSIKTVSFCQEVESSRIHALQHARRLNAISLSSILKNNSQTHMIREVVRFFVAPLQKTWHYQKRWQVCQGAVVDPG